MPIFTVSKANLRAVPVDTDALVEGVVLGPQLSDADCDRVVQCADTVRLGDRVTRSVLSGRARYV